MSTQRGMAPTDIFDVAIIGAGVVGCAAARRFALAGAKVIVLEKGADILSGASKANSAILHTGFDAPSGSLELELVKAGRCLIAAARGIQFAAKGSAAATLRCASSQCAALQLLIV